MFCTNCGTELEEGVIFCGNCGSKIEVITPTHQVAPTPQVAPAMKKKKKSRKTKEDIPPRPKLDIVGLIVSLFGFISVALVMFLLSRI